MSVDPVLMLFICASPERRGSGRTVRLMADAEGWFIDPYGVHEHRWFSAGSPTKLVRDQGLETYDPPPDGEVPMPLVPVPGREGGPETLRRADDAEAHSDGGGALRRADDAERGVAQPDVVDDVIAASIEGMTD